MLALFFPTSIWLSLWRLEVKNTNRKKSIVKGSCLNWVDQLTFVANTLVLLSDKQDRLSSRIFPEQQHQHESPFLCGHITLISWETSKYSIPSELCRIWLWSLPTIFLPEAPAFLWRALKGLEYCYLPLIALSLCRMQGVTYPSPHIIAIFLCEVRTLKISS